MKLFILALTTLVAAFLIVCFYFTMKDKPFKFFLWMMSFSVSCYEELLIGFPSDIIQTFFFTPRHIVIFLATYL